MVTVFIQLEGTAPIRYNTCSSNIDLHDYWGLHHQSIFQTAECARGHIDTEPGMPRSACRIGDQQHELAR